MRLPSGDQAGFAPGSSTSGSEIELSSVTATMRGWLPLDRAEEKAMRLPSGDHVGAASSAGLFVRLIGSPPFAFTRKMSPFKANAICLPSGDHAGSVASPSPCVTRCKPSPSMRIT
jgi:hypothetical protein